MDKIFLVDSMQNVVFEDIIETFPSFISKILSDHNKLFCIIDEIVLKFLLPIKNKNILIISFKALEKNKSRKIKEEIEDKILKNGLTKKDAIIAIGGGITLDLAGFIASTILRGIDLYFIPTTLLAMVDASIGGKNGVNTQFGKNLIGSFYLPKKVWIDTKFLSTLSYTDILNGLSEIIKYAIIADNSIFSLLNEINWISKSLILNCITIKKTITTKDFSENNLRLLLNFGHTIGHAIEFASNYKIPHGIAVFYGMIIEIFFSPEFSKKYQTLLLLKEQFYYPKILNSQINWQLFKSSLQLDKKRLSNKIPIVVHSPITSNETDSIIKEFSLNEVIQTTKLILNKIGSKNDQNNN